MKGKKTGRGREKKIPLSISGLCIAFETRKQRRATRDLDTLVEDDDKIRKKEDEEEARSALLQRAHGNL